MKTWDDNSYVKDGVTHNELIVPKAEDLVLPYCNTANVDVSKGTAQILLVLNILTHGLVGTILSSCLDRKGFNWNALALVFLHVLPFFGWVVGVWHMYSIYKSK